MKRILALSLFLAMSVGMCSCSSIHSILKSREFVNDETIYRATEDYLKEKYGGQEFVAVCMKTNGDKIIIDCHPKGSDSETEPVRRNKDI